LLKSRRELPVDGDLTLGALPSSRRAWLALGVPVDEEPLAHAGRQVPGLHLVEALSSVTSLDFISLPFADARKNEAARIPRIPCRKPGGGGIRGRREGLPINSRKQVRRLATENDVQGSKQIGLRPTETAALTATRALRQTTSR